MTPKYNKPETLGISMNFDNSVSIYHQIAPEDGFVKAAQDIFALVKEAQSKFPNWQRILYLDIYGHKGENGQPDEEMIELQQEFFFSAIAPFLTAFELPIVDGLNPNPQRNDVPDRLNIA
jgi:hypothetical protein